MKNNTWKLVVLLGVLMIAAAGLLCIYNVRQNQAAEAYSEKIVEALKKDIPEPPAESAPAESSAAEEDLFAPYEQQDESSTAAEAPAIIIDSDAYCGYLELPSLGLELPVMSSWSYPALKKSPCRYSGSAQTNDLIIAAHNYHSHFGRIGELRTGDEIVFTDAGGSIFRYKVSFMEVIEGQDVEQMFSGQSEDWDLTLFTCTLSGQSRVTIRADRIRDEAADAEQTA